MKYGLTSRFFRQRCTKNRQPFCYKWEIQGYTMTHGWYWYFPYGSDRANKFMGYAYGVLGESRIVENICR